jgi:hypothetical protein
MWPLERPTTSATAMIRDTCVAATSVETRSEESGFSVSLVADAHALSGTCHLRRPCAQWNLSLTTPMRSVELVTYDAHALSGTCHLRRQQSREASFLARHGFSAATVRALNVGAQCPLRLTKPKLGSDDNGPNVGHVRTYWREWEFLTLFRWPKTI